MSCSDNTSGARRGVPSRRIMGSTLLYRLAISEVFTATSLVASATFDEYVLTDLDFEGLGPGIVDIVVHSEGSNFSANFTYNVVLQYKFELGEWLTGGTLLPLRTNGTYAIGTPFTNRAELGVRIRIVLRTQVSAGSTATQRGTLSVNAAVRLYSGN